MADDAVAKYTFKDDYTNPRGIPRVEFVSNVAELVRASGNSAETLLRRMSEQYSKYKLAEHRLIRGIASLEAKLPEIDKTMRAVQYLQRTLQADGSDGLHTHYGLTESVFCEAHVPPQSTVHLWLGANVMVEYSFDEALALLERNKRSASENLAKAQEDLSWLQEQQTILEVNTSRVYNYDVVERRKKTAGTTEAK